MQVFQKEDICCIPQKDSPCVLLNPTSLLKKTGNIQLDMPGLVKDLLCNWNGITRGRYELQSNTTCNRQYGERGTEEPQMIRSSVFFPFFLFYCWSTYSIPIHRQKEIVLVASFLYFLHGGGQKNFATKYFYLLICKEILNHLLTETRKLPTRPGKYIHRQWQLLNISIREVTLSILE